MSDYWTTYWTITPSTVKRLVGVRHTLFMQTRPLYTDFPGADLSLLEQGAPHRLHQVIEKYARYFSAGSGVWLSPLLCPRALPLQRDAGLAVDDG